MLRGKRRVPTHADKDGGKPRKGDREGEDERDKQRKKRKEERKRERKGEEEVEIERQQQQGVHLYFINVKYKKTTRERERV